MGKLDSPIHGHVILLQLNCYGLFFFPLTLFRSSLLCLFVVPHHLYFYSRTCSIYLHFLLLPLAFFILVCLLFLLSPEEVENLLPLFQDHG